MIAPRIWTRDEISEVERMAAEGLSVKQTADKIGASYNQVRHLRRKLDIRFITREYKKPDPAQYDAEIRNRWKTILPELKANLLRDIADNS